MKKTKITKKTTWVKMKKKNYTKIYQVVVWEKKKGK